MPRVWTRITRWTNFIAHNFTPGLTVDDQTNSVMRVLHVDSVFQAVWLFRLVHLDVIVSPRGFQRDIGAHATHRNRKSSG